MDKIQKNAEELEKLKSDTPHFYELGILIFIVAFAFFAFGNAMLPITDPVESNYALTAKEMVQSGNWLSPQIYHQYWYDKPIMIYWLVALSYKIFGIFDFAARIPSALFGALAVTMMYQEMRTIAKRRIISLWAAVILGTSLEFWIIAHGVITDMVLLFTTLGTMSYAYRGLVGNKPWLVAVAYGFAGLSVLTKGPVGLVLPGILLLVFALFMRSWTYVKRLFPWQGILLFCLVALPWYGFMYEAHGQAFLDGFLGLNNISRATVSEHPEYNVWWYYLLLCPLASLPWTGAVFYAMVKGWKLKDFAKRSYYVYLMVWGWGTILFYSLMATKYPTYTFISLLPFSVLGSVGIIQLLHNKMAKSQAKWFILTGPAIFLWIVFFIASFFVEWGNWYLLYLWVIVGIIGIFYLQYKRKKYFLPAFIAIMTMLISAVVIHQGVTPLVIKRSSVILLPVVKDFKGDIYYLGGYETSLVYYNGKQITYIPSYASNISKAENGGRSSVWEGKYTMPKGTKDNVFQSINSGTPVLLIVSDNVENDVQSYGFNQFMTKVGTTDKRSIYITTKDLNQLPKQLPKGVQKN